MVPSLIEKNSVKESTKKRKNQTDTAAKQLMNFSIKMISRVKN